MTDLDKLAALAEAATPTTLSGQLLRGVIAYHQDPPRYIPGDLPYWDEDAVRLILAIENEARDAAVRERDELRAVVELAREFSEADRAYLDAPMDDDQEALYHLRDARERLRAALHPETTETGPVPPHQSRHRDCGNCSSRPSKEVLGRDSKPVSLMAQLIGWVGGGGPVIDPFLGSGTTAYAAKTLGVPSIGIEIEERYCEIAATRCSQEVLGLVTA